MGNCFAASRSLCAFPHPSTQACAWRPAKLRCKDSSIAIRHCVLQGLLQDKPAILLVGGGEGMGKLKATVEQLDLKLQGSAQVNTECWGVVGGNGGGAQTCYSPAFAMWAAFGLVLGDFDKFFPARLRTLRGSNIANGTGYLVAISFATQCSLLPWRSLLPGTAHTPLARLKLCGLVHHHWEL